MMKFVALLSLGLSLFAITAVASEPVMRVVRAQPGETNLLGNGGFEAGSTTAANWSAAPQGYRLAPGEGRSGSRALFCEKTNTSSWVGASQAISLNRTSPAPLVVRGWSRAENVSGSSDSDYSIYVDIVYTDGSPLWGRTANFSTGTHDWVQREFTIIPEKPVRSVTVYCLFRGQHTGRAWFDDVSLQEITATGSAVVFQGSPMIVTNLPAAESAAVTTRDGLRLGLSGNRIVSVRLDNQELGSASTGGFMARDVAADSDVYAFDGDSCAELGLQLEASLVAKPDHIVVEGRLTNTRASADRAILLLFALPVAAEGWQWGDDIHRSRKIEGAGEYLNADAAGAGTTGSLSRYPVAAVYNAQAGLALALDMGKPALYRLVYHAGTKQLFLAWDLGLVPETSRFPGGAEFRCVIYRFDPQWGFRAAWQKLTQIFPTYFKVRSPDQGIWMPFTDVGTVEGWQDFGFRYHEGNNNVRFDDTNSILSFRYTEPMTWWMSMSADSLRTEAEAIRQRDQLASGAPGSSQAMATAAITAGMQDAEGHAEMRFLNTPWSNGAVWSLNPNPYLSAPTNGASVHWNASIKSQLYGPGARGVQDGEYLDSIEGYVTADLNFRREHFRDSTVPLTFAQGTFKPALYKGLAVWEFTKWLSDDVHSMGKLMFANGVPYRFGFLAPWLDVMGTETDWMPGGKYQPSSDAQLCLWRTLSGQKPYLVLMNTDYAQFTPEFVEQYFQRCLAFGFYPSMFSHNASENPYWRNPAWYNRDRPLFKKYMPLIKKVAEAGWMPVTSATCSSTAVALERFGTTNSGAIFFTAWNSSSNAQSIRLKPDAVIVPDPERSVAVEMLSGERLKLNQGGWEVTVGVGRVAVVRVEPGPRVSSIQVRDSEAVIVSIESPADLEHVLEQSVDLVGWTALRTNPAQATPLRRQELLPTVEPQSFFRLRW